MSVKGSKRPVGEKELFVGFTNVRVVAINPDREQLNKLLGKEDSESDKPIAYLSQDNEGNDRLRMAFWLYDDTHQKYFVHSFNLTNKVRKNKLEDKIQLVNSTCSTTWVPFVKDEDGNPTSKIDENVIQDWFSSFLTKDKEVLGKKKWTAAISGQEELATIMRIWLGKLNFNDPETEVLPDLKKLFSENYKELRSLIDGEFATPFTVLLGVRTDESDSTKKYQQVYGKSFLQADFVKYINNGMKFPKDYHRKAWTRFEEEVTGEYGFDCYTKLEAFQPYNEAEDIASSQVTKVEHDAAHGEY